MFGEEVIHACRAASRRGPPSFLPRAFGGGERSLGALGDYLALVFGDGGQDVDGELVGVRVVGCDEKTPKRGCTPKRTRKLDGDGQWDRAFRDDVARCSDVMSPGRRCGTLKAKGRDVGAILIEEGLAMPFIMRPDAVSSNATPMVLRYAFGEDR
jgi:hypothetical protein